MKQYRHFLSGVEALFDEEKGYYVSKYLDRDMYTKTRAFTVQSLFPILLPEIDTKHKNQIIAALKDNKQFKS